MPEQPLDKHVAELRRRSILVIAAFILFSAAGFLVSAEALAWIQNDLALKLHALTPYAALYTQIMIAFLIGFFASLPILLYELLRFAEPGLKPGEYRVLRNFLPVSYLLFLLGAVFSYQFIVKSAFRFFKSITAASDVEAVWGLQNTVGMALKLSALSGLLFQLPVAAVVLGKAGLITADSMREYRVYVIVSVLVLAAVATPPDLVSQVLVTLPVLGLYEASILLVSWTSG